VAVAAGEGMAELFRSVGCSRVISGGPTMNPSTADILAAVEDCPSDIVIVLPNDKNIVMAAEQGMALTKKSMRVVRTRSIPEGIAALLALNQDVDLEANVRAMEEVREGVRTIEVCRAVRSTSLQGTLEGLVGAGGSLVTLYYGAETGPAQAEALAEQLRERYSAYEVEVVFGGQPHYQYIVSLE
jgi:hypothetical protein